MMGLGAESLDVEAQALVTLFALAVAANDGPLQSGLQALALGNAGQSSGAGEPVLDRHLIAALRARCSEMEAVAWGQVMAAAVRAGDAQRMADICALVRRRVAQ